MSLRPTATAAGRLPARRSRRRVVALSTALGLLAAGALAGASSATAAGTGAIVPPPAIPTQIPTSLPPVTNSSGSPTQTGGVHVSLTMTDGVVVKGALSVPSTAGKHPAVILINAWGGSDTEDASIRAALVKKGYVALEYAPRGINPSGGTNDVAGPKTVGDVSTIINWVLKNTPTNPKRIATMGVSYGAGIGMLAAAKDKRIRAVAALSGWEDMATALDPNGTVAGWTAASLDLTGKMGGTMDPASEAIFQDIQNRRDTPAVLAWAKARSPSTYLAQINKNNPAVFMASASTEHVFPIGQTADMFTALTTPKRLEMRGGDHAYVEGSGNWGFDNVVWDDAYAWLDTYVGGTSTVGKTEAPVYWLPRSPFENHTGQEFASVAAATKKTSTLPLGGRTALSTTGSLGGSPTTWSTKITGGIGTTADAGTPLGPELLESFDGIPPPVWTPGISSVNGSTWESSPLKTAMQMRGRAKLHITVTPSTSSGTLFFYLFADNPLGVGSYITHEPVSWSGKKVGVPFTIDLSFEPMSFDIPAGYRIVLATDTKDSMYYDQTTMGAKVTFSSSKTNPSYLKMPSM